MFLIIFFGCVVGSFGYNIPEATRTEAPLFKLNDGHSMPSLAFGTWLGVMKQESGSFSLTPVTSNSTQKAVEHAIEVGFRHIDTAAIYMNEDQVGRAVQKKIAEGVIKREDMFITTKLWNDYHATEDVVPALCTSLAKLNLDYVDLYLIHWPMSNTFSLNVTDVDYLDTWKGMVEAQRLGLTKSIGVANFDRPQLDRLLRHSEVKPAVLQIEVNLNIQQDCLQEYAKKHDIVIMGYTPFGSLFPSKATPRAPPPRVNDPELVAVANKYGKTVPQLTLRYLYELGVVPIPKAEGKEHIEQNFDIFDFELQEEDKAFLKDYDRNYKSLDIPFLLNLS